jgi:hypothetical protein
MNDGVSRTDPSAIGNRGIHQHHPAHLYYTENRYDYQESNDRKFNQVLAALFTEPPDVQKICQFNNLITARW